MFCLFCFVTKQIPWTFCFHFSKSFKKKKKKRLGGGGGTLKDTTGSGVKTCNVAALGPVVCSLGSQLKLFRCRPLQHEDYPPDAFINDFPWGRVFVVYKWTTYNLCTFPQFSQSIESNQPSSMAAQGLSGHRQYSCYTPSHECVLYENTWIKKKT